MYVFFKELVKKGLVHKKSVIIISILAGSIFYILSLPKPLFDDSYSTVLQSRDHQLMAASISEDGQWRFPESDSIPPKFEKCIIQFEDRYFYDHPGFNPFSLLRAAFQNIKEGKIVSGGSTITMQVIRLSRRKNRTFLEKLKEIILATRLELRYSKKGILSLYASHAPFGGNVVGLEAAAWKYYRTSPEQLSWAEMATLSVLPNQPALIYPGKNNEFLLAKRKRLLQKLLLKGIIDGQTYDLALQERMPEVNRALPNLASHALQLIKSTRDGKQTNSTIDFFFQQNIQSILEKHQSKLTYNEINNLCVLVANIENGEILSYIGNSNREAEHQAFVDIIQSRRSPGSALKPFLYGAALDDGLITPQSILPDIPLFYNGFCPKNFSNEYEGVIHADQALARSLNIPFVYLLKKYSYPKFNQLLKLLRFQTIDQPADHYGLSIILGGAEVRLWDLANAYLGLAQQGMQKELKSLHLNLENDENSYDFPISPAASHHCIKAMTQLNRPGEEAAWQYFSSSQEIAWKTGTSWGYKDAWSVGFSPEYLVAVWVGNADGEGRPGLIGAQAAAPVMFDILNRLPQHQKHFPQPRSGQSLKRICVRSGNLANPYCEHVEDRFLIDQPYQPSCREHIRVFVNNSGQQVSKSCDPDAQTTICFRLKPEQASYYKRKHPDYKGEPEWSADCASQVHDQRMALIYPAAQSEIYIPLVSDGEKGKVVFEAAHQQNQQTIFWHLDDIYLGSTEDEHVLACTVPHGKHSLTLIDEKGFSIHQSFTVLSE